MDFISWAGNECRVTKRRLVWHETVLTVWYSRFAVIFLLTLGLVAGACFGFAYYIETCDGSNYKA